MGQTEIHEHSQQISNYQREAGRREVQKSEEGQIFSDGKKFNFEW